MYIESRLRQLNRDKIIYGFGRDLADLEKEAKLHLLITQAKSAHVAYSEAGFNQKQRNARKAKLSKAKLSLKQFWKLVRKVSRKSGGLTAVKDKDGCLYTEIQQRYNVL